MPARGERLARAAAVGDRRVPDQLPELAQTHREVLPAVDEDDLVLDPEQPLELGRDGQAAEAAAEDQRARHELTALPRLATTSSSVGANLSMCCCTRPIRSLNSGEVLPAAHRLDALPFHEAHEPLRVAEVAREVRRPGSRKLRPPSARTRSRPPRTPPPDPGRASTSRSCTRQASPSPLSSGRARERRIQYLTK